MNDSIILYISQYTAIKDLTDEQIGRLFRAIFEKQLGNEVVLADDIKIAFNFINNQLVIDKNKYKEKCEKNRENGKKGGAPKGNQNAKKTTKQPNGLKNNPNDNDNENENENDIYIINNNNTIYDFVQQNFGRVLSPAEYEEINSWNDNELTRYAIKQSVLSNKCVVKYISRILNAYERENIKTVQQAQERERQYIEAKKNKVYNNSKGKTPVVDKVLKEIYNGTITIE